MKCFISLIRLIVNDSNFYSPVTGTHDRLFLSSLSEHLIYSLLSGCKENFKNLTKKVLLKLINFPGFNNASRYFELFVTFNCNVRVSS